MKGIKLTVKEWFVYNKITIKRKLWGSMKAIEVGTMQPYPLSKLHGDNPLG
jgi:hypothetical protein